MIKAQSSTAIGESIISDFTLMESEEQWKVWFGRVPTASNIADSPSRLAFQEVIDLGAEAAVVCWADLDKLLKWSKSS